MKYSLAIKVHGKIEELIPNREFDTIKEAEEEIKEFFSTNNYYNEVFILTKYKR